MTIFVPKKYNFLLFYIPIRKQSISVMTFNFHEEDSPAEKVLDLPAGRQGETFNGFGLNVEKLMKKFNFSKYESYP